MPLSLLRPSHHQLRSEMKRIHEERADLRAAFGDLDGPDYLEWFLVHAPREYPDRIGRWFPPLPPEALRHAGSGGPSEERHLALGLQDYRTIGELFEIFSGRSLHDIGTLLDFGCGCGRVLRWFEQALPRAETIGTEIRADSAAWCQQSLRSRILLTDLEPRIALADDTVDLVYAISVFAHLSADSNIRWLRELARICRPDGLLILSAPGAFALFVATRSPDHRRLLAANERGARAMLARLRSEGFLFVPRPADRGGPTATPPAYDQAVFDETFVRSTWSSDVEVMGHVPAAQELFQDLWIARPRTADAHG